MKIDDLEGCYTLQLPGVYASILERTGDNENRCEN